MAPKKAMKGMKAKGLEKPKGLEKLKKVMKKPKASSSKPGKANRPGKAKRPGKASKLSKASLEKLGQMSLKDKMKAAAEGAEDPNEAAIVLHDSMSKLEKSKAWSKHQTALKHGSKQEQAAYNDLSKKDKGIAAAAYLLEKEGKQFMTALKKVSVGEKVTKADNWETELQMLAKFTPEELDLHLQSGRVVWRECPSTWGAYEYKDTQCFQREITTNRAKEWQSGVEYDPMEEDLEKFMDLFTKECHSLEVDDHPKGKGSGKSYGKGKGLGKGKTKNKSNQDTPDDKLDTLEKVLKACKTARNMVASTQSDLELALEKAKSKLNKAGRASAETALKKLGKALGDLKAMLSGKNNNPASIKKKLMDVAQTVKEAKDETKELKSVGGKAQSTAGSRRGN